MATTASPALPFEVMALGLAGITYGEFDLAQLDAEAAPFQAALLRVASQCNTPVDRHAVRECWYVATGTGTLSYDGGQYPIQSQQLLFFESHHPHSVHNTGDEDLIIFSLWWPPPEGFPDRR